MEAKVFTVIGGDRRNIELARMLYGQGHTVKIFGFANYDKGLPAQCESLYEAVIGSDCIVGPIPCSHNGETLNAPFHNGPVYAEDLFSLMLPEDYFIAGYVKPEIHELAKKHNVVVIDLLNREELLIKNAIPTAEGAIKIAIEETDITLHGSRVMVIGYGRIGKILSGMLKGMGAEVMAVVNSNQAAAQAVSSNCQTIFFEEANDYLQYADIIFNTVPKILLDKKNMGCIRKDTLIIDLASPPYGVDVNDSRDFGLRVLYTNSLPGKIAPVSTAGYILETINSVLTELKRAEVSDGS